METGIPAESLADDDLRRELAQLDRTREHIEADGTEDQKRHHVERHDELQAEAEKRFGAG